MDGDPHEGIVPDAKDWTWTLTRRCPDCRFAAGEVPAHIIPDAVRAFTAPWPSVLARADARTRPDPATWSPLEYGCHVRDVCVLFERRMALIRVETDPAFANWDQDDTALAGRYGEQDPDVVATQVLEAADGYATSYGGVPPHEWTRTGRRSDGSAFTLLTLGQYGLHDLAHHLWDVGVPVPRVGP
ncbi:MAG: DinB family protein [Dermatophilaceae bacterium]